MNLAFHEMLLNFFTACKERKQDIVLKWLEKFSDLAHSHVYQNSPLVKIVDEHIIGYTALHFAAENGDIDLANCILNYEPNINAYNMFGTPLHVAMLNDHEMLFGLLLVNGADVNLCIESDNAFHILYSMADCSDTEFIKKWTKILINAGCDVNHASFKKTPLSLAPPEARPLLEAAGARKYFK